MPTVEDIKQQLQSVGTGRMLMMTMPTQQVANALTSNEQIIGAAQAKFSKETVILIVTNTRALIFGIATKAALVRALPLASLVQVDYTPGTAFITLVLTTTEGRTQLDNVIANKQLAERFATHLDGSITDENRGALPLSQPSQVVCPKCGSAQITANQKGFELGKAAVGGVLLGPVGLLGGFLGSKKVQVTCLQCGHSWQAGTM